MESETDARIRHALRRWVEVKGEQATRSVERGNAQEGRRASVVGAKHLEGLNQLVVEEISRTGAQGLELRTNRMATLAGFYRASKAWDLLVLQGGSPVLAVEYKSMSGSEGKNLNNRADEVFGIAEDARQAESTGFFHRIFGGRTYL
jgi:hypothetical protein